ADVAVARQTGGIDDRADVAQRWGDGAHRAAGEIVGSGSGAADVVLREARVAEGGGGGERSLGLHRLVDIESIVAQRVGEVIHEYVVHVRAHLSDQARGAG